MNVEDLNMGNRVVVEPLPDDLFDTFQGRVIGFWNGLVNVEDEDGDTWSVTPEQVSLINE